MKAQLNLRKGKTKEGFRILKRFSNMKEAREYLKEYVKTLTRFKPTIKEDTFYDEKENELIWLSRQFSPTGVYTYPRIKQQK